jgi:hypothetical protein
MGAASFASDFGDSLRWQPTVSAIANTTAAIEVPRNRDMAASVLRSGEEIGGGLSQFSFDEDGIVPFGIATVVDSPVLGDRIIGYSPLWIAM